MKKALSILAMFSMVAFGTVNLMAEEPVSQEMNDSIRAAAAADSVAQVEAAATAKAEEEAAAAAAAATVEEEVVEEKGFHQVLKEKFIQGGAGFMGIVLIALILGLALCIERIIYLNMASPNSKKLIDEIESALQAGGVEAAKEVCRNTKGPVASIFYQGLDRMDEGIDMVEKSIISYGSVQLGLLERNISWISLFIALAPMLGFMGTVIGMIGAFDAIEAAGDISPSLVAGGIKVALLTTVFGLIVAMILQVFYNYIIAKVDSITNSMEDASISLVDLLVKHKAK